MYVHCVYAAMSKSPKDTEGVIRIRKSKKDRQHKVHILSFSIPSPFSVQQIKILPHYDVVVTMHPEIGDNERLAINLNLIKKNIMPSE
jgi:hypothetical protein